MPLDAWGFKKYGTTKPISVYAKYENHWGRAQEGTWEWLFGGTDYNNDSGTGRTLKAFKGVANTREDLYKYTCKDHGDGSSNDNIQYINIIAYFDKEKADKAMEELYSTYSDRMKHYVKVEVTNESLLGINKYFVTSHQTPAFFMMSLADLAVYKKLNKYDVAPKYQYAKASFAASAVDIASIGGLTHPHMPGTYYLIARNNVQPLK
jgi:hypothetical protein